MKAYLLYRDRDIDLESQPPPQAPELTQDLELERIFDAMAAGDPLVELVCRRTLLSPLQDPAAIAYRQAVLRDCIAHPTLVRDLYQLATEAVSAERRLYRSISKAPDSVLRRSIHVMEMFLHALHELRDLTDGHNDDVCSEGFRSLLATLASELDDAYLATAEAQVKDLSFRHGTTLIAHLGNDSHGTGYRLHRTGKPTWRDRLPFGQDRSYSFEIAPRDDAGFKALGELRGRGINGATNAVAQAADHILSFFAMMRAELGFYVGCLNLHDALVRKGEPVSFPIARTDGAPAFGCSGLYDVSLSLSSPQRTVGNDIAADGVSLIVVTGANQGGKSTFLRSVGQAQLMMQSGMFVGAERFEADLRSGVFTHFKREEDDTLESGKFDEELRRMSGIADLLDAGSMVLFNESFAATNEREGSEIARQVLQALQETGIKVVCVTHLYDLASRLHEQRYDTALFLRAPRRSDGTRTFRLETGDPLSTSFGADVYRRVFGQPPDPDPGPIANNRHRAPAR